MPVVIACSACQRKLSVPESLSGKAVKCPKCGQAVRVTGGAAPVPTSTEVAPAPAKPVAAPPPAAPISVSCTGCQKKLQVKATLAGKAIKCPGCGKVIKVPAPAPPADDWIEINEAYAPPPAATEAGPVTGDWGQGLMDGHAVPDAMQEEIRTTLRKGERLVWFERPKMEILLHQARLSQLVGILLAVGVPAGVVLAHLFLIKNAPVFVPILLYIFAAAFAAVGAYMAFLPSKVRKGVDFRPCFALTNRRLLIHRGKGSQVRFVRGEGVHVQSGNDGFGAVIAYVGLELTHLSRVELRRFRGAGELMFRRSLWERPRYAGMFALSNVRDVERMIREKLVHPLIDRLLRGDSLALADKGKLDQAAAGGSDEQGEVISPDANIKDYVSGRAPAVDPEDPNIKDAPGAAAGNEKAVALYDPKKVPPALREQVETELTDGERILWVGQPEGGGQGRGLFGALFGGAYRVEPRYTLYALTSRRVLLWHKWGWKGRPGNNREYAWNTWGPHSYYSPALRNLYVESDKRIANGGSIVFKRVKLTITQEQQQQRGGKSFKKTVETFHFGLLHIGNVKAVARLLYQTLLEPIRGL